MKKGQQTILFAVIILMISFIIMIGAFGVSQVLKDNAAKNVGGKIVNSINAQIEEAVIELKFYNDSANLTNAAQIIKIPKRIGDQEYIIFATPNDTVTIKTINDPNLIIETNMSKVWDVNYDGLIHSICGQAVIEYINITQSINIKCTLGQNLESTAVTMAIGGGGGGDPS